MSIHPLILCILLLGISAGLGRWCIRENDQFSRRWQATIDSGAASAITHFIRRRTYQFLAIITCSFFVIIGYDWELSTAIETNDGLIAGKTAQDVKIAELETKVQNAAEQEIQMKAELEKATQSCAQNTPDSASGYYPPSAQNGIESVYNPEISTTGNQAELDRIKKHYEELLVNHMFLKKCGKAQPTDIHIIISALSQEMASINAPGRLQYDILTSARGSYNEIYANSPCDSQDINSLYAQYQKYIDAIAKQLN